MRVCAALLCLACITSCDSGDDSGSRSDSKPWFGEITSPKPEPKTKSESDSKSKPDRAAAKPKSKSPFSAVKNPIFRKKLELAESGNALALADCGLSLINGTSGLHDPQRGLEMLTKAAEQGELFAQCELAKFLQNGIAGERDPALALKWLNKAADAGSLEALQYLGFCYRVGHAVPKDRVKSNGYYRKVLASTVTKTPAGLDGRSAATFRANARQHQNLSALGLAWNYYKLNDRRAFEYARKAAAAGLAEAQYLLGMMHYSGRFTKKDTTEGVSQFTQAADQGHLHSQLELGSHFDRTGDLKKAADWLRVTAGRGHANSRFQLGLRYWNGTGRTQDKKAAARWFKLVRLAANDGDATSQGNMGYLCEFGIWISKDESAAADWYRKPAMQGNTYGQYNLGRLYALGRGVPKNLTTAASWYRKAADAGHAKAQYYLGRLYEKGTGVTKDLTVARQWFQKAADQGNALGKAGLKRLAKPTKENK